MYVVITNYDFIDNLAPKFNYPKEIETKIKKESVKHLGSFTTYINSKTNDVKIFKNDITSDIEQQIVTNNLEEIELSNISSKNISFIDEIDDDWQLV